jgi:hypothetical protein
MGLLPVTYSENTVASEDEIRPGEEFLSALWLDRVGEKTVESIARDVRRWYSQYNIGEHATRFP